MRPVHPLRRPQITRTFGLVLVLLAPLSLLAGCISVERAPPAPVVVTPPPPPSTPGGVTPGQWQWNGSRYVWVTR